MERTTLKSEITAALRRKAVLIAGAPARERARWEETQQSATMLKGDDGEAQRQ